MKFVKYTFTLFISSLLLLSQAAHGQVMIIKTIAGAGEYGFAGDGGPATAAYLYGPTSLAVNSSGDVYFVDFFNFRVRKISTTGVITTVAGNGAHGYTKDTVLATSTPVNPQAVAVDKHGNLYISDIDYVIRKVTPVGLIYSVAGSTDSGYAGDGGPAINAKFGGIRGIAVDTSGNIFVADAVNNVVRKISTSGIITTVAGNDTAGFLGDNTLAIHAELDSPYAVAVDHYGNLFISDYKNNVIRKVDTGGIITRYAGMYGVTGYSNIPALAVNSALNTPGNIAVDTAGNLFIPDAYNNVVREVVRSSGIIKTVVGNHTAGFGGDTYTATAANLYTPFGVAVDVYGSIYIADANNQRVREVYNPYLAVPNLYNSNSTDLFPNPTYGQITLNGLNKADKVSIYDMLGRQAVEGWEVKAEGSQTFDVSSLATGVYLLQVRDANGNKKSVTRLIKE